jgi:hypothetical protein
MAHSVNRRKNRIRNCCEGGQKPESRDADMLEEKESKLLIKMSSETLEKMVWSPENTSEREENFQKMVSSRQSASETSD